MTLCECGHEEEEHGRFCGSCPTCSAFRPAAAGRAPATAVAPAAQGLGKIFYREALIRARDLLADLEDRWLAGSSLKASLAGIRAMRREISQLLPVAPAGEGLPPAT